jgi:GNAT superfamily N-acetyltransferase
MTPVIRVATPADARGVAHVVVTTWRVAYKGMISDAGLASLSVSEREDCWKARLGGRDPNALDWTTVVCEEGSNIIGFATSRPCGDEDKDSSSVGEVLAMYVLPDHWGRGLGKRLMDGALDQLKARSFSEVSLWVVEMNSRARRFYESAGFQADGLKRLTVRLGTEIVEVRYIKK